MSNTASYVQIEFEYQETFEFEFSNFAHPKCIYLYV